MKIELDKPYKMVKFPKLKHAQNYCINHGFYIGCICTPIRFTQYDKGDKWGEKEPVSIDVKGEVMVMNCGVAFFNKHFELDYRTINLNELGI